MHILITRPERDAADLKARIEGMGHRVSVAPLLEIVLETIPADAFKGASAVVATSRNGLRALTMSPGREAALLLPAFVVGPGSADLARALGFATILTGPGTAAELVTAVAAHLKSSKGPLVHLAGDHLAFDLAAALQVHGISVKTLTAYRSVAAETFEPDIAAALAAGRIDAVILMSPRTAHTWRDVTARISPAVDLSKVRHLCLSAAVAEALRSDKSAGGTAPIVNVALRPTTEDLLALVFRLAAHAVPE